MPQVHLIQEKIDLKCFYTSAVQELNDANTSALTF